MNSLVSRDLVQAAKRHISFLEEMHKMGISLRTPLHNLKSFHRYVDFWLPLVQQHPNLNLIPPADIAWLWHCHRLAPQEYEKFMHKEYNGAILEATAPFSFQTPTSYSRTELVTQSLWKDHYPLEPFFLQPEKDHIEQAPSSQQEQDQYAKTILQKGRERLAGYCVFASAQSQRTLLWQISEPWYKEDEFLQDGVKRYHQFLQLAKVMDRSVPLVPTFQIDLLWHTHILTSVQQYRQDCLQICGRPFSHDDSFNDRSEGGSLETAFHKTCDLWKQQYSTNYVVEGAMYRGEPPQEYFDEYETWDGSEWTVEWGQPSLLKRFIQRASDATHQLHPGRLLKKKAKKRSKKSKTKPITWNDLLQATGTDCWNLRKRALDNGDERVVLPVNQQHNQSKGFLRRKRPQDTVQVLGSFGLFQQLEAEGMDKRQMPAQTPKSLTQEIGAEWERQRELVAKKALARVKEMSLQSVDQVSWDDLLRRDITSSEQQSSTKVVDLKKVVVEGCLDWMMRLFAGSSYDFLTQEGGYAPLAKGFLDFWNEIRARQKSKARLDATQAILVDAIVALVQRKKDTEKGGIIHHIFHQKLATEQAAMNCVNAMVAAFDATVVVVFWTLWNVSRTQGTWDKCRNELLAMQQNSSTQEDIDELDQLGAFKKAATEGQSYDCSSLSYLSRSMAETIRVFPPVWTLPRVDPKSPKGQPPSFIQLDVAWTNRALNRDWNPDRASWEGNTLASFGAGKRHCPGGTAALFAARRLLRRFVVKFETAPLECEQEHAIRSIYLGPTLCVEGPQYFELEMERKDQTEQCSS